MGHDFGRLGAPSTTVLEVSDPVLSIAERDFLKANFGTVDAAEPSAFAHAGRKTLFYMPHCPLELYAAVLRAAPRSDVVILGNSFKSYAARRFEVRIT